MDGTTSLGNGDGFYDQEQTSRADDWQNYERESYRQDDASMENQDGQHVESDFKRESPVRRSRSPDRKAGERSRDGGRESRRYAPYSKDGKGGSRGDRQGRRVASRECRVYITNIPYDLKWQELKDIMRKAGDVMYVEMIMDSHGQPRGNAVVEFAEAEDAAKAISEFEDYEVMGRKLKIREDKVDDEHYQRQLRQHKENDQTRKAHSAQMNSLGGLNLLGGSANSPSLAFLNSKQSDADSTVFISNLDYKISWQKVKDIFRKAGNVLRVDIAEDDSKRSKGFGTVVFSTPMEALQAVSMFNGFVFGDRAIIARLDRESSLNRFTGGSSGHSSSGVGFNAGGGQSNSSNQGGVNPLLQLQLQSLVALSALAGGGLGNLSALTGGSGGGSSSSMNLGNQAGLGALGNAGLGAGLGGLGNLLSSLGGNLGALGQGSALGSGMSGLGDSTGLTGSSSASMSRMGSSSGAGRGDESGRQIFVRNLPWKTTWQDLKDRFRHVGHVVRADIITDDRNRSKGCGTVLFEHADEAQRAVAEMNGFKLDGRDIEVRMDRM